MLQLVSWHFQHK